MREEGRETIFVRACDGALRQTDEGMQHDDDSSASSKGLTSALCPPFLRRFVSRVSALELGLSSFGLSRGAKT